MCICQNSGKNCHCSSGKCSCGPKCSCSNGCSSNNKSANSGSHEGHKHNQDRTNNHNGNKK